MLTCFAWRRWRNLNLHESFHRNLMVMTTWCKLLYPCLVYHRIAIESSDFNNFEYKNRFFIKINNWTIPYKLNERGIKWTICILRLKGKGLQIYHFRRKCISSDTKWLNIINAKHCISSLRSFNTRWSVMICKKERKNRSFWWYARKQVAWWYTITP